MCLADVSAIGAAKIDKKIYNAVLFVIFAQNFYNLRRGWLGKFHTTRNVYE